MTKRRLCKIVVVALSLVALISALVLPASAGVLGYMPANTLRFLPFNLMFGNGFNEDLPFYEFSVLSRTVDTAFGTQNRNSGTFGSEDYLGSLASFVVYPNWTSYYWYLDQPIRYVSSYRYDYFLPELRCDNVLLRDSNDELPNEYGGVLSCQWDAVFVCGDGTEVNVSNYFTTPITWNENGYLKFSVTGADYALDTYLADTNSVFADNGGVWYIKNISFLAEPDLYTGIPDDDNPTNNPDPNNAGIVIAPNDGSFVTAGYSFVRQLSATQYSSLTDFGESRVELVDAGGLFGWVGTALSGIMNAELFTIFDVTFSISGILTIIVGLLGFILILRALAGG